MATTKEQLEIRYKFGLNVKRLRKEQHLSQAKLALMVGRDRSFISRIERGRCNATFDTIVVIAEGFGISPAQLLAGIADIDDESIPITLAKSRRQ